MNGSAPAAGFVSTSTFPILGRLPVCGFKPSRCFPTAYVEALYTAGVKKDRGAIFRAYAKRWALLRSAHRNFDLVWMEKEAFPYLPASGERLLNRTGVPYVVDYDDATFHQYDSHRRPQIRRLLGGKIAEVMRCATTVIVGNSYLGDYARASGAMRVEYLPTAVDIAQYLEVDPTADSGFTIGWIGTPLTAAYLAEIRPALEQVSRNGSARLHLVGAGTVAWPGVNIVSRPLVRGDRSRGDTQVQASASCRFPTPPSSAANAATS
jgi:hypothetical protein